jgi:acyl dehydratase
MTTPPIRLEQLSGEIGRTRGPSSPVLIDQERIDTFADATNDPQWIHVDVARASESAWGGTIAHGFLTLSMLSAVMDELVVVEGASHAINYGLNRVRLIAPVRSGSVLTGTVTILQVREAEGHVDMTAKVEFFVDEGASLVCVAESLTRYQREAGHEH